MIVYSKKEGKMIVETIFEMENAPENENINKVITYGVMNLGEEVVKKKVKIYDSDKIEAY